MRNGFLGQIATPGAGTLLDEALTRMDAADWQGARLLLDKAVARPEMARDARLLLAEVCQAQGEREAGLAYLNEALAGNPLTSRTTLATPRRRVLALAVPGDFQANLPISLLLDDPTTELHTLWLTDPAMVLAEPWRARGLVPRNIDLVFTVIAQDDRHEEALRAAEVLIDILGLPAVNAPRAIAAASRAGIAERLQGIADLVAPLPRTMSRKELACLSGGGAPGAEIIVRPAGSHAGQGLARIAGAAALDAYLDTHAEQTAFTVTPFVDFSSPDGLWRKYRAICVDGVWQPLHLAIHTDWAVWYYNAEMQAHPDRQREEMAFLSQPGQALPSRAQAALATIAQRVRLDYFGIDFGVLADGRLVLFEIETGMIVHDRDDPSVFGYRRPAVRRIRAETEQMIDRRIDARSARERRARPTLPVGRDVYTVTRRQPAVHSYQSGDPLAGAHLPC